MTDQVVLLVRDDDGEDDLAESLAVSGAKVHIATPAEAMERTQELSPTAIIVQLGDHPTPLAGQLAGRTPATTQVIAIGSAPALVLEPGSSAPDCVLFPEPDDATVASVLAGAPPLNHDIMLDDLLTLTVLGPELEASLNELTMRVAHAFGADDCVLFLAQEATCYTAKQISESVVATLVPLAENVTQFGTTLIATAKADRPYRALLAMTLAQDQNTPIATLLLCREKPVPFHRAARRHLRNLTRRLATDLSFRLVQERLLADRDKLRGVARIDPVLGVANRTTLQEELSGIVAASEREGQPFSVAVIDVDGLRLINERSGYPAGDAVLSHIALTAKKVSRPQDLIARYASDSVAIVLPGLGAEDAQSAITKILSEVDAEPVMHEDKPLNLTVSAGIAELRYDVDTGETALARAMAARQAARLHGEVIQIADATMAADVPAQVDFAIGTTLGGVYQIRHEISRGAFGVVYRAEDLALGRQVALKLLRPDLARDTNFVERFRSEAATLARIRNANLVQVYAFGIDGENVYFAMELVEGQGLDERIEAARRRRRHIPLPEVLSTIDQVGQALEAVHSAGVLHRDVKPENVLIDRINRRCVLVDVGIAVRRGSEKNPAGTPGFTAPEVFGEHGESPATDVYSLGALAYLMLTLQAPFGDANPIETLTLQATQRPAPLTSVRRDLPPAVNDVLLPALDPDPRLRPQSARALSKALAEVLTKVSAPESRSRPRATMMPFDEQASPEPMRVAFKNASLKPPTPQHQLKEPSSRGVMFRAAYEVLGARRGSAWMTEMSRKLPDLAAALAPGGSQLSWFPTASFVQVLESLASDPREVRALAEQLGRRAILSSFTQFYGADPGASNPEQVLRAAGFFWRCYHTWGAIALSAQATRADITLSQGFRHSVLCSSTAGLFAGVIERAGGDDVEVAHPVCIAEGGAHCVFRASWKLENDGTVFVAR